MPAMSEDVVFNGARFDVKRVELARSGEGGSGGGASVTREIVVPRDAVVVLPLVEPDKVVLIRNERFAVGETLWELPAGTLESGEEPAACAKRELEEETGYRCKAIEPITAFYSSPGFCTEKLHAFVATGLTESRQNLDETERIEPRVVELTEALAMVKDGRIEDAKTIATLLFHAAFGGGSTKLVQARKVSLSHRKFLPRLGTRNAYFGRKTRRGHR